MRSSIPHDFPDFAIPSAAKRRVGLHDAYLPRPFEAMLLAVEQPIDFESDGRVGDTVEVAICVLEREGVGVG